MARKVRRASYGRAIKDSGLRVYQGKEIRPVLYSMIKENGGRKNKICGLLDGEIIRDRAGTPLSYRSIPNER